VVEWLKSLVVLMAKCCGGMVKKSGSLMAKCCGGMVKKFGSLMAKCCGGMVIWVQIQATELRQLQHCLFQSRTEYIFDTTS